MFNKPSDYLIPFLSDVHMRCSCELTYLSIKEIKEKRRIWIKEFNDEVLNLVAIQDKLDKNNIIGEQQQIEIDKLDFEILQFAGPIKDLEVLLAKNKVERQFTEELIKVSIEKISELKHKLECEQDLIMQEESEAFEIFPDLYDKRKNVMYELYLKEIKLEKLGVSIKKN